MFDRDMCYLQVSDRWCADHSIQSSSNYWGARIMRFLLTFPSGGKKWHQREVSLEKHCAATKTWLGIVQTVP